MAVCAERLKDLQLLITDIDMPRMGGHAVVKAVHSMAPGLSIIAMSGADAGATDDDVGSLGVQAILAKPLALEELLRTVHRVLVPAEGGIAVPA